MDYTIDWVIIIANDVTIDTTFVWGLRVLRKSIMYVHPVSLLSVRHHFALRNRLDGPLQ